MLLNDGAGHKRSANSLPSGGTGLIPFTYGQAQMLCTFPSRLLFIRLKTVNCAWPALVDGTPGSAAAFDAEGDGDTDLFIGGGTARPTPPPPRYCLSTTAATSLPGCLLAWPGSQRCGR